MYDVTVNEQHKQKLKELLEEIKSEYDIYLKPQTFFQKIYMSKKEQERRVERAHALNYNWLETHIPIAHDTVDSEQFDRAISDLPASEFPYDGPKHERRFAYRIMNSYIKFLTIMKEIAVTIKEETEKEFRQYQTSLISELKNDQSSTI